VVVYGRRRVGKTRLVLEWLYNLHRLLTVSTHDIAWCSV